jgi:hypothetical protein
MPDDDKLTPATRHDVETRLSLGLTSGRALARFSGSLVAELESSGFVIMRRPPVGGSAPLNPPPGWPHTKPEDLK